LSIKDRYEILTCTILCMLMQHATMRQTFHTQHCITVIQKATYFVCMRKP